MVDSSNSFAAWPAAWKQFDKDICQKDTVSFLDPFIELKFFVDELLCPGAGDVDVVVIGEALVGYSFKTVAN